MDTQLAGIALGALGLGVGIGCACGGQQPQESSSCEAGAHKHETDEEVAAMLTKAAKEKGLDIAGGTIRRTSSRFCLGVEHGDYNGTELFGACRGRVISGGLAHRALPIPSCAHPIMCPPHHVPPPLPPSRRRDCHFDDTPLFYPY